MTRKQARSRFVNAFLAGSKHSLEDIRRGNLIALGALPPDMALENDMKVLTALAAAVKVSRAAAAASIGE